MKTEKKWQKPELAVMTRSKPEEITGSSRSGRAQYSLGPAPSPAPADGGSFRSGRAQYYLGPAPTPTNTESFRSGKA